MQQQYTWKQLSECNLSKLKNILEKVREELYEIEKEKNALISAIMQTQALSLAEHKKTTIKNGYEDKTNNS